MKVIRTRTPDRCDRVREWISLGLDDELSRIERALAERHLALCDECARFSAEVRAFTSALRATPLEPLERPIELPARRRVSLRPFQIAAAAAIAVMAVGLASLSNSLREDRLGARITAAAGADDNRDQLRARQLHVLTNRIAQARPRSSGAQPV